MQSSPPTQPLQPAVFFDRDDTLMRNVPYLGDPALVEAFADARAALTKLRDAGFLLFIVSNQSGVGRGLITREQVAAVNEALFVQIAEEAEVKVDTALDKAYASGVGTEDTPVVNVKPMHGGWFRDIYNCYASPHSEPDHEDRKPSPGLLLRAAREHGVDLTLSYFIGDRISDIECGLNAGATSILVLTGTCDTANELEQARARAHYVATGLLPAAEWILQREAAATSR